MKRLRFTAWLLVLALLALACPALGEAPDIELAGEAAEALPVELEAEDIPELEAPDGLDVELPGLDLSDGLSQDLDTAPADDANGDVPATF